MSNENDDFWSRPQPPEPDYANPSANQGFNPNPQQQNPNATPQQYWQPESAHNPDFYAGKPQQDMVTDQTPNPPQQVGVFYPALIEHPSANGVLVLGLLSILLLPPLGIIAVVMGNKARRETRDNPQIYTPSSTLNVGWAFGIAGTVITTLLVAILTFAIIVFVLALGTI